MCNPVLECACMYQEYIKWVCCCQKYKETVEYLRCYYDTGNQRKCAQTTGHAYIHMHTNCHHKIGLDVRTSSLINFLIELSICKWMCCELLLFLSYSLFSALCTNSNMRDGLCASCFPCIHCVHQCVYVSVKFILTIVQYKIKIICHSPLIFGSYCEDVPVEVKK